MALNLNLRTNIIYEVHVRNYSQAGTFTALTADLDRIKALGVDTLWLMPIHPIGRALRKGNYGSPYAILDYRDISSDLGDLKSFQKLVAKTHSLGMKLILDVVFNHAAIDSVLQELNPHFFLKNRQGELTRKVTDWTDVYDLDYTAPQLWNYLIETLRYWQQQGVDGFRCDVASLVPVAFWEKARQELARERPMIWLAESLEKSFIKSLRQRGIQVAADPELYPAFDITYDYDGFEYLKGYLAGKNSLQMYLNQLYIQETLYPEGALKLRFLENHDNLRAAELFGTSSSLKNWTAFYLFLPGPSLVYMGQEYGFSHYPDFFEKDVVPWNEGDREFQNYFTRVVALAKEIKGECTDFQIQELLPGLIRIDWRKKNSQLTNKNCYTIIINLENRFGKRSWESPVTGIDLLTGKKLSGEKELTISRYPRIILQQ